MRGARSLQGGGLLLALLLLLASAVGRFTDSPKVCQTMDIRNYPSSLDRLRDCEVVEGRLSIVLIERVMVNSSTSERLNSTHFQNFSFPKLREITGHLIMYRVKGLRSIGQLFPNLSVIRGKTLFKDFALVVFDMEDLQTLGLKSLTNIQRGAVRIERNDKLCYVDTVDWQAIAPYESNNNIIRYNSDTRSCGLCPGEGSVYSGDSNQQCYLDPVNDKRLCWDSNNCQKVCPSKCGSRTCMADGTCCDVNCLGGCSGPHAKDCDVCRHFVLTNGTNRVCVNKCPDNFYMYYNRRCVTEMECRNMPPPLGEEFAKGQESSASFNRRYKPVRETGSCVFECPPGYNEVGTGSSARCVICDGPCRRYCTSTKIESLELAQSVKGCTHIQGDLEITIRGGGYVMKELEDSLGAVQEIEGALRISRSFALVTLSFLKSLTRIGGHATTGLNAKKPALFIFDNPNLEELWDWHNHPPIQIDQGKLFIHFNPKLCYSQIEPLKSMTLDPESKFDELEVSKENNGDKVSCVRETLNVTIGQLTSHMAVLNWKPYCMTDRRQLLGYSIYYTVATHNVTQYERRDACQDVWKVDDMPLEPSTNVSNALSSEYYNDVNPEGSPCNKQEPLFHFVPRLTPYTRYAAYVKTYTTQHDTKGAQSPIVYFTTLPGQPSTPMFTAVEPQDPNKVLIKWMRPVIPNGKLVKYVVLINWEDYSKDTIGQINYCLHPGKLQAVVSRSKSEEDKKKSDKEIEKEEAERGQSPRDRDMGYRTPGDEQCTCPANKPKFTQDKEAEQLEAIRFENDLQNMIYVKRPRSKRSIDTMLDSTFRPPKKPPVDIKNETEKGYMKMLSMEVEANVTELMVDNLRHFTWYTVSLWACREVVPEELNMTSQKRGKHNMTTSMPASPCSDRGSKSFRTLSKGAADMVKVLNADLLPGNRSSPTVKLQWKEPDQPNGLIAAYTIRHTRVDNENQVSAPTTCVTQEEFVKNGFQYILKNLAPGNYSITVTAVSLSGTGPVSMAKIVFIPERPDAPTEWIYGVVAGCVCVLLMLAGAVWYARRGLLLPSEANKLFASVNPEYASTVYVPDEWEVPRDKIELVRELGQGSFGMVYEGIAKGIVKGVPETRCAVKTVNEHATDRERVEFLNEASVMKAFDTHHVVRLLGVVSRGQPTLVIMELMESGDLKSYLRSHRPDADGSASAPSQQPLVPRTPPTLQQIQQMAIEIADGMAYLSARKFVHRDLAARNCMVAGDLTVKVGDFGMTRDIYETDYYRKGSKGLMPVRWMSPESLKDGVFSSNSDVWSYGVVLWEMATLAMQPYQGLSNEQVLRYVTEGGVMERPERCPDRLYELMRACWAHRPSGRPSFLQLVASLAPTSAPHFRHRSFFHTPHGQELYAQQQQLAEERDAAAEVGVGAVASGGSGHLFGASGRLASWVREVSASLRSHTPDDAAEPLAPSESRAIVLKSVSGPNGVLPGHRDRYTRDPAATSDC